MILHGVALGAYKYWGLSMISGWKNFGATKIINAKIFFIEKVRARVQLDSAMYSSHSGLFCDLYLPY